MHNLYVINVNYKVELNIVDQYLLLHRDYLDSYYTQGLLLCSGPKDPRDGGIIIALMQNLAQVEQFIANDPFKKNGVAEYVITKFQPVKSHPRLKALIT